MYGCWEIQIASSVGASKVMSLYRMRSQPHALILCVSFILYAWGRAKAWVHWRNGEVLLLNPVASKGSTRSKWPQIPPRIPLGIMLHNTVMIDGKTDTWRTQYKSNLVRGWTKIPECTIGWKENAHNKRCELNFIQGPYWGL